MQDSLRIRLETALKNKYPDYLRLDEVEAICKEFKKKLSNAERRFRSDSKALTVRAERVWNDTHKAIIGYKYIPSDMMSVPIIGTIKDRKISFYGKNEPSFGIPKKEKELSGLDERLSELLKKIPKREAWQYGEVIRQINEALKSTYENTKKRVLDSYEKKF